MFLVMAVPMALTLLRRPIRAPRGFAIWLLFLVWVVASVLVLWTDAPGIVAVHGPSRMFIFSYRMLWYFAITVVLLYVGNMTEEELPARDVVRMLGFMFVLIVAGGLIAMADPHLQFHSLAEYVLPHGVRSNAFIQQIIHPRVAEVQSFL